MQIDLAIAKGPGPRWAVMGPCMAFHVASGDGGMAHNLDHFGPALKLPWTRLEAPELTQDLRDRMVDGCDREAAGRGFAALAEERDRALDPATGTDKDDDQDGLTNAQERELGTNPQSEDSDSDGLSDYDEKHTYGTNPALADTDGDGLMDGTEVSTGHDPLIEKDKERIQKLITLLKNENLNFVFPEGWFFTESKSWQWTTSAVYPWVYSNNEKGWMYFSVISKRPFYSYQTRSWSNY